MVRDLAGHGSSVKDWGADWEWDWGGRAKVEARFEVVGKYN